ncbi:hypothetical protein WA026_011785 [Henosepilachna vigintioctopunctata]|uniref:Protein NEDD1 n=1 Tax=Henosepilachna vigintioctopunctata TaxID=420089 RepID=A0AAW1UBZ5_9CUCU
MLIASSSTTVKFHSFPDGELIYNYQPGPKADGPVRDISWSKDGMWLSLVPNSGPAEIISVRNQLKLLHTITDVEEPSCTAFQNNTKKFIAYGTKNGLVLVYDIKSRKIKNRFPRASSLITHVEYTARDTHLVAGCLNGDVLLYSNLTLGLSSTYRIPRSESVSALRTNPSKRNFIIGGSNEGVVVVWDTNVNKHKFFVESHKAPVTGVAFSPINSDLVISTGADRQFCCYDIISNKCIASVPVNNTMTAVDFSHDGTHFIMSSQEGNICLYDSRRILDPVFIFEAHKSSIKNIALQKQEISNTFSNISEEKVISDQTNAVHETSETKNGSLRNFLQGYMEPEDLVDFQVQSPSVKPADSFMVAMGLGNSPQNCNSIYETSRNYGEGDHKWNESKPDDILHKSGLVAPEKDKQSVCEIRSYVGQKQILTSTPNYQVVTTSKLDTVLSPITNTNVVNEAIKPLLVPEEQIRKITEDIVRKEMSDMFNSFSYEMKYQFMKTNTQIRRVYLDLQMSMVKESIKVENNMNKLREDIASNSPLSENYLLEENLRLKKQIALLEEQLANKSECMNGN